MDLPPESETKPQAAKAARKRRTSVSATEAQPLAGNAPSTMKPLLIGLGVGAAVAATALILGSQTQRARSSHHPSFTGMLAKAALFSLARLIVQRAGSAIADKAALKAADVWAAHTGTLDRSYSA